MTTITANFPEEEYKTIAHYKIEHNLETLAEAVIKIIEEYKKIGVKKQ